VLLSELPGLSDQSRGLRPPLLIISDCRRRANQRLPRSLRQRCLIHRCRNYLAKVPAEAQTELREAYWTIFDTDDLFTAGLTPGPELVAAVQHRIDTVAEKYARAHPAAVKCLLSDREQLTSYLRFPVEHHKRIRHSNFIERTFGETRRRVKVIGRLPGEASCLNLVWAVLDRASRGGRGMTMTLAGTTVLFRAIAKARNSLAHGGCRWSGRPATRRCGRVAPAICERRCSCYGELCTTRCLRKWCGPTSVVLLGLGCTDKYPGQGNQRQLNPASS
jgi:hypothetical protein